IGDPRVPGNEHARDILLGLRFKLDLYVNFRPVRLLHPDLTPLRGNGRRIDFVIFRENTEGVYLGRGRIAGTDYVAEEVHTAPGSWAGWASPPAPISTPGGRACSSRCTAPLRRSRAKGSRTRWPRCSRAH